MLLQKHITIYETLKRIGDAEQRKLDTWSISLTSGKCTYSREICTSTLPSCKSRLP